MSQKQTKLATVAFKVDAELADLLNRLPNKSAFIRKAIAEQLDVGCPLCHGQGVVPRGIHDHYALLIEQNRFHTCAGCPEQVRLPDDSGVLRPEDRERLQQFFSGGPLYCDSCYRTALLCQSCGWHIDSDRIRDHMRSAHTSENA